MLTVVTRIYQKAKDEEHAAKCKVEEFEGQIERLQKLKKSVKESIRKYQGDAKTASQVHDEKRKWRKKVQKRNLFVTTDAMRADNSDLGRFFIYNNCRQRFFRG